MSAFSTGDKRADSARVLNEVKIEITRGAVLAAVIADHVGTVHAESAAGTVIARAVIAPPAVRTDLVVLKHSGQAIRADISDAV